eukprot:TRINITY_DN346_c0_g1_i1.p1 TRINITY_DN346_c0_g1~~TRINITY_DN346_c0_g1_i1.p1  ORF type:complete len:154 (+),score=15.11 TRINITY_DN346_c0_g1_i1:217-678(+)
MNGNSCVTCGLGNANRAIQIVAGGPADKFCENCANELNSLMGTPNARSPSNGAFADANSFAFEQLPGGRQYSAPSERYASRSNNPRGAFARNSNLRGEVPKFSSFGKAEVPQAQQSWWDDALNTTKELAHAMGQVKAKRSFGGLGGYGGTNFL